MPPTRTLASNEASTIPTFCGTLQYIYKEAERQKVTSHCLGSDPICFSVEESWGCK